MELNNIKDKLKNKKTILGLSTTACLVAIVIVLAFFNLVLDPSQAFTAKWWTKTILLFIFASAAILCFLFVGQASNAQDERSNLAKASVFFGTFIDKIKQATFDQWVRQRLEPIDQAKVYDRIMLKYGIKQSAVLNLSRKDIKSLINNAQRIGTIWYDEITDRQYKIILKIKDGKYNIHFVDPAWYLTDSKLASNLTRSELASEETSKHSKPLFKAVIGRIFLIFMFCFAGSMFTTDVINQKELGESLMNLFTQLSAICSGAFTGYLTGVKDNDISAFFINIKANTMKEELEDTDFKPKTIEEIAKEKFEMRVKMENEIAIQRIEQKDQEQLRKAEAN